eukprot:6194354-Pleurochrysis_carterae.AAC.5
MDFVAASRRRTVAAPSTSLLLQSRPRPACSAPDRALAPTSKYRVGRKYSTSEYPLDVSSSILRHVRTTRIWW